MNQEKAAETHVNDMDASNRYLKHTGSKGSRPIDRIGASGYKPAWVDLGKGFFRTIPIENAASGQSSPAEVVKAWMNSPPHRAAILNPSTRTWASALITISKRVPPTGCKTSATPGRQA